MDIKRYDIIDVRQGQIFECLNGGWCKWSDISHLIEKLNYLEESKVVDIKEAFESAISPLVVSILRLEKILTWETKI